MVRISVSFIVFASFISTALTITNAFFLKKQFYPSIVYLTKSSTSMAIIYFQAAVLSYLVFSLIRWLFFGQIRAAEIEHAQERVWHAIMETCLAFTVFRDDFSPKFVVQFVILFFIKAFHWLAEDRVDYMERSPVITLLFHTRILGIISLLSAIDSYFISHAFFTTLMRGASAQIVFGFEYAVLLTMIAHITINYILHLHDLRSPHPWENKAMYMLYAELLTSFLRCVLYLAFAVVMIKIHTFPLFAIRPFYLTLQAFRKAVNDVILSRRAINAMNNLFPLATAEDLAQSDNTCIICREEMTVENGVKKLPCNHIFHPNCLRSWFQRQQTCPTCRTDVLANRRATVTPEQRQQPQQPQVEQGPIPFNAAGMLPNFHPFQFQFHFAGLQQQQNQQQRPGTNALGQQQQQIPPAHFIQPPGFPGIPPQFLQPNLQQQPFATQTSSPIAGNGTQQMNGQVQTNTSDDRPSVQQTMEETASTSASSSNQQQPTTGTTTNANGLGVGAQQFHSLPPSFANPFMFLPFGLMPPPPPLPFPQPPSLSGLSDAEIIAMEGMERRAVEARIQVLRNISVLLDAAMLQFQQYLTTATPVTTNVVGTGNSHVDSANGSSSINNTTAAPEQRLVHDSILGENVSASGSSPTEASGGASSSSAANPIS